MNCCLWVLVAVRLICPFSIESNLSLVRTDSASESVSEALDDYIGNHNIYWDITKEYKTATDAGIQPISGGEGHSYVVTGETPDSEPNTVAAVLAPIWLLGILGMFVYALISYQKISQKVAASLSVADGLYLCDYIESPFILGIVSPKIYLPSSIDPNAASHVLAHERAHIQRRDHWWKPLGYVLLALHWFNPIMWLAYVLLCRDIELACDEKVIRQMEVVDKKAYSEALLKCSVPRRMIAACPLAFGEVGVKERVKSVLNYKKPGFCVVVIAVIVCVVATVCFLTDPVKSSITEPKVTESSHEKENTIETDIPNIVYGEPIEYSYGTACIQMYLPETWEYEIEEAVDEDTPFGINFRPEGEEGWLKLQYWPGMFGVCGTGLTTASLELRNGREGSVGYYDGSDIWSYIRFPSLDGDYVVLNEGADNWLREKESAVLDILEQATLASELMIDEDERMQAMREQVAILEQNLEELLSQMDG